MINFWVATGTPRDHTTPSLVVFPAQKPFFLNNRALTVYYTAPCEGRSGPKCGRCSFIIFSSHDSAGEWHFESMASFKSDLRGHECRRMRQFAARGTQSSRLHEGHESLETKSIKVMLGFKYDISHRNKLYFSCSVKWYTLYLQWASGSGGVGAPFN